MKRTREIEIAEMAASLMLLSKIESQTDRSSNSDRVFSCKTCNRQFASFQALGGHRTSHKKPKLMDGEEADLSREQSPAKAKTHECSICGLEFAIGQALGGHMRRHRNAGAVVKESLMAARDPAPVSVLKKSSSGKRVMCLDLNLTPLENDLKLHMGLVL